MAWTIKDWKTWDKMPYSEEGQNNSIRWNVLKNVDESTFVPVTYSLMCKDFLNEVIMCYHTGKPFSIYGFQAKPSMFNKEWEGLPVLLTGLNEMFYKNLKIINKYLKEHEFPQLKTEKVDQIPDACVVNIPEKYMENTFFISQITLFMRMANLDILKETFEELGAALKGDKNHKYYQNAVKKPISKMHKDLEKYIYYWNPDNNFKHGDTKDVMTSHIHNCGVVNWGWKA